MSIPVEALTENDYLILEYINKFDRVSKNDIKQHFKGRIASLDYRLSVLSRIEYKMSGNSPFPIQNSNYIDEEFSESDNDYENPPQRLNIFYITDLGKVTLQDHINKVKSDRRNLWLKNAWIPIIVSFATTNVTMYLVPKLPLILKWLFCILKRIF